MEAPQLNLTTAEVIAATTGTHFRWMQFRGKGKANPVRLFVYPSGAVAAKMIDDERTWNLVDDLERMYPDCLWSQPLLEPGK